MAWDNILTALSTFIAAAAFVYGVSAWQREFVGKRRIELAESVLSLFYKAEDVLREIRDPVSSREEGRTRKRRDGETQAEATHLDDAFVLVERYQRHQELFAEIKAMRYRYMATFGRSASGAFDSLDEVRGDLLNAARLLGEEYWPKQGTAPMTPEEREVHLHEMHRLTAIFWNGFTKPDPIDARVSAAVASIETVLKCETEAGHWVWTRLLRRRLGRAFRCWV